MSKQLKEIQGILASKADEKNLAFSQKIVPGTQKIYGVKNPELNIIVRQYKDFSFDLAEGLWTSGALEEKIIAIKIIEISGKKDPKRVLQLFRKFSRDIDNWAVCDGLGMQFLKGIVKTHSKQIFSMAGKLNRSADFWQRRLSLVMVEWYTRDKTFHKEIRQLIKNLDKDREYYVKKAITWLERNFKKGK
jgi:3-methyladenine DNA glycosylase AlkD